jgi:hypothetical protein
MSLTMRSIDDAFARKWVPNTGREETLCHYFGEFADDGRGPQGFLTSVTNRTIPSHNHAVDQFQVMFGNEGAVYQRHAIAPLLLHYADAFSTYGPIFGADPSLRFFTLRPRMDKTMNVMPEDKANVPYFGRRQKHLELDPVPLPAAGEVEVTTLIEVEADGLEALSIVGGPDASFKVAPAEHTRGQYVCVTNGTVDWDGRTFGEYSLGWQAPSDEPAELHAGPEGCRVLVLRFPSPATNAEIEARYLVPASA